MLSGRYDFFLHIAYIEYALIILIIVTTFILYVTTQAYRKARNQHIALLQRYILYHKENWVFKKEWENLYVLIHGLVFENKLPESAEKIRKIIILKYLLPMARKKALSKFWISRCLAAKAFNIYASFDDEKYLEKLLNDRSSFIVAETCSAVRYVPTSRLCNFLIDLMTARRRKAYEFYLSVFRSLEDNTKKYIIQRLRTEKDPYTRAICYRILLVYKPVQLIEYAYQDALSDNVELAVSAIRFIAYTEGTNVIGIIAKFLTNKAWEVKVVAIQILAQLKAAATMDRIIPLLTDKSWWVRVNAQNALKILRVEQARIDTLYAEKFPDRGSSKPQDL